MKRGRVRKQRHASDVPDKELEPQPPHEKARLSFYICNFVRPEGGLI
jgi:hypothetical protein